MPHVGLKSAPYPSLHTRCVINAMMALKDQDPLCASINPRFTLSDIALLSVDTGHVPRE